MRIVVFGVLALSLVGEAAPVRKPYVDRVNGVSFTYPGGWLLNGDDDAATAKLRITIEVQPSAIVQLEGNFAEEGPYRGTDFESGAFAYVVASGGTEASCFSVLDRSAEGTHPPAPAIWNGLPARKLDATYTVAGTDDIHHIVAAFRNARCYLFETVVIKRSADTVEKPIGHVRWRQIQAAFDAVLNSVRVVKPSGD